MLVSQGTRARLPAGLPIQPGQTSGVNVAQRFTNRNLPQQLLKARDALMAHFRPILHHFGLTEQQWRILRALDEHGQLEPREICTLCQILSSSMAGILARMEETGFVQRARVDADQRRVLVSLAPKGDTLIGEMAPLIELQYQYLEQAFGEPLLKALSDALAGFIDTRAKPVLRVVLPPVSDAEHGGLHGSLVSDASKVPHDGA
jgi:homoprotocatechuate degradation regulator HpaR